MGIVKERIESVGQMKDVVSITPSSLCSIKVKQLIISFNILPFITRSQQETAKLELENYVQQQKIAVGSRAKVRP